MLDSYEVDYKQWENLYRAHNSYGYCSVINCLELASNKAEELANIYGVFSDDQYRYPIMVVNLYIHQPPKIYSQVNKHLLLGSEEKVWQVYSDLLSKALSILSPLFNMENKITVYRGQECRHAIPKEGETHRFGRFLSTSLEPFVALSFALKTSCSAFIQIDNAVGLRAKIFSSFPGEEEIIIDHNALFYVRSNLNDSARHDVVTKDKIYHQLHKLFPGLSITDTISLLPDVYVHLVMSNTTSIMNDKLPEEADAELRYRRYYYVKDGKPVRESGYTIQDRRAVTDLIREDEAWKEHLSQY